ncbi:hypothetical protein [Pendulispora albinea]|uniref:Uncharacterized protein n=1 Tax=Pendulispora albinea TaxID=2741071 RepID=A0ABZ2LWV7_9BACT
MGLAENSAIKRVFRGACMKNKFQVIAEEIASAAHREFPATARALDAVSALYPGGIAPAQMVDAIDVVRVVDQLASIARSGNEGDAWRTVATIGLRGAVREEPGFHVAVAAAPPVKKAGQR